MAAPLGPWPARVTWALLPLTLGPALGEALEDRSDAVATTGSAMAWGVWALVLGATVLPRTVGLTLLRVVAPTALAVSVWAALAGEQRAVDVVAVVWSALTLLAAFAPTTGDAFVNGSSYGAERRMLLRVPTALLLGPLPLAWAALVGPILAAPLLLASEQWVQGALAIAVGVPATVLAGRAVHGLARRWVVFVPAGFVLHDLHAMVDPVLFPRARVARLGPSPDEPVPADGIDLSMGALGLVLQLELREPLEVAPRRPDRMVQTQPVRVVRFAPTRPGAVLAEARERRLAVG